MRRPLLLVAIFLIAFMGFLLQLGVFDRVLAGQTGAEALAAGQSLTFTGQVYQKDSEKFYVRSVCIVSLAADSQPTISCKDNLICMLEQDTDIPLGKTVLVTGSFQPFSAATNPGEFDARAYYRTLGIGGRIKGAAVLAQGESFWHLHEALYQLRGRLKERLEKVFPEWEAAIMCALLLGDKEELDPDLKELYQRNGILHILSISSLHITMIGMSVYKLLRRCRMPVCPSAVLGCGLLFLYGMMTGFSVSACRAIGMYLLRMTAEVVGRTYDMPTAMGVMAAVLVVKNPYYLKHAGFLLSFTSMIGIGVVYPAFEAGDKRKSIRKKMLEPAVSGISITLATLPVQLWFYYQVPSYSVLLNILVLPFMKVLMGAGFLSLIPGLGFLGRINRLILQGYEELCSLFDGFPCHTWNPGKPGLWQTAVYYLVLAAVVCVWKKLRNMKRERPERENERREREQERPEKERKRRERERERPEKERKSREREQERPEKERKRREREQGRQRKSGEGRIKWNRIGTAGCAAALLLNMFVIGWQPPAENQLLFLDVGQGDGILVRTASGENYLFDCGSSSRSQVGRYVLLPCLRYYGIQTLDAVILSHPDADHVNGVMELLEMGQDSGVEVKQLVLPELAENGKKEMLEQLEQFGEAWKEEVPIGYLSAGEGWQCGSAKFICLHPEGGCRLTDPNVYSICIYGVFQQKNGKKEFDFLLTGDVEGVGEEALLTELQKMGLRQLSVLKVAHHGSKNSTPESVLEQISPALAVISCGRNNRYGHPHGELLKRLENVGSETVITAENGAIGVSFDGGNIRAEAYGGKGSLH